MEGPRVESLRRRLDALLDGLVKGEVVRGEQRQSEPRRAGGGEPLLARRVDAEARDGLERRLGQVRQVGEMEAANEVVERGLPY